MMLALFAFIAFDTAVVSPLYCSDERGVELLLTATTMQKEGGSGVGLLIYRWASDAEHGPGTW